jgi:hypothetical protein
MATRWSAATSIPMAAYGRLCRVSIDAGRPILFSVSPVSRSRRRSSRSVTRLETVALLRPVDAAMSAREQGA